VGGGGGKNPLKEKYESDSFRNGRGRMVRVERGNGRGERERAEGGGAFWVGGWELKFFRSVGTQKLEINKQNGGGGPRERKWWFCN